MSMVTDAKSAVTIAVKNSQIELQGVLKMPAKAVGVVIFPYIACPDLIQKMSAGLCLTLAQRQIALLTIPLYTAQELESDKKSGFLRFNIQLGAQRLQDITQWLGEQPQTQNLPVFYFAHDTAAAACVIAAVKLQNMVQAIISIDGRLDLVKQYLPRIVAPVLLMVREQTRFMDDTQDWLRDLKIDHSLRMLPQGKPESVFQKISRNSRDWVLHFLPK